MATNLYSGSCTPNLGGVKDFYTKDEVNKLLNAKSNISTTYTRLYLDGQFDDISNSIAGLSSDKIGSSELNLALSDLQDEIEQDIALTYATLADTYTKTEVDNIVSGISVDPGDYIKIEPQTTEENTIYPGSNNAIALTVRGSSTNPIVARWLDNTGDVIGYVSNDGNTTLEGKLSVGRSISDGDFAINVNNKRITGLSSPVLFSDSVSYGFLAQYVQDFYENTSFGIPEFDFQISVVRNSISAVDNGGDGSFVYDNIEGVLTYTGPSASEVRAHFSGGTGVTITDGVVSIGQPVGTGNNVTFNNATLAGILYGPSQFVIDPAAQGDDTGEVVIRGDLTVQGTTTTINSTTVDVTGKATFDTLVRVGVGTTTSFGDIAWNPDEGTIDVHLLNNVVNQVGQEIQLLCRNGTANAIPNGTAVMFFDTIGNSGRIVVVPMVADGTVPGYVYLGITTQSINPGEDGYVTTFGKIRGVKTNIDEGGGVVWQDGDILWCDPATPGGLTKVEPEAPNLKLPIAAVISAANNGVLMSRWDTGRRLSDLHDVESNGSTSDGELLIYSSSNSRWEHGTEIPSLTVTGSLVVNGTEIVDSARDVEESRLIRRNGTVTIGLPGTVPFGVGPVIPPGMSLVGIGPDSYNVIDVYSGSVC